MNQVADNLDRVYLKLKSRGVHLEFLLSFNTEHLENERGVTSFLVFGNTFLIFVSVFESDVDIFPSINDESLEDRLEEGLKVFLQNSCELRNSVLYAKNLWVVILDVFHLHEGNKVLENQSSVLLSYTFLLLAGVHDKADSLDDMRPELFFFGSLHLYRGEERLEAGHELVVESDKFIVENSSDAGEESEGLLLQLGIVCVNAFCHESSKHLEDRVGVGLKNLLAVLYLLSFFAIVFTFSSEKASDEADEGRNGSALHFHFLFFHRKLDEERNKIRMELLLGLRSQLSKKEADGSEGFEPYSRVLVHETLGSHLHDFIHILSESVSATGRYHANTNISGKSVLPILLLDSTLDQNLDVGECLLLSDS